MSLFAEHVSTDSDSLGGAAMFAGRDQIKTPFGSFRYGDQSQPTCTEALVLCVAASVPLSRNPKR